MPKHLRRPSRRRLLVLEVALAVVLAVAAGTTAVVLHNRSAAAAADCASTVTVRVDAAPAIAPIVSSVANTFNATGPDATGACTRAQVNPESAPDVADNLNTGPLDPPELWIPDSSLWPEWVQQQQTGNHPLSLALHPALASSPLVLAAPSAFAAGLKHPVGWHTALMNDPVTSVGDPRETTEGLLSLTVAGHLLGVDPSGTPSPKLVEQLLRVYKSSAVGDMDAQFASDQPGTGAHAFTASEQSVFAQNQQPGTGKFTAIYPVEGTLSLDYPVVRVTGGASKPAGSAVDKAAAAFEQDLRAPGVAKQLVAAGFRNAAGDPTSTLGNAAGVKSGTPHLLPAPSATEATGLLRAWTLVNVNARFLDVVDVSGSMTSRTPTGETRIKVVQDASNVGLAEFPDSTEIGMWEFSDQLAAPNDYREVVPVGRLNTTVNGQNRRSALSAAIADLPNQVHGDTALYNTILAAYQSMQAGYDPSQENALVIMTDGRNETKRGLDLPSLLAQLKALKRPDKPLPVFAIGISGDADLDALNQITAVTGGKTYEAESADDIVKVYLDVMMRRVTPG
jgi:Ca-activated chloride channel homolog